MLGMLLGVFLEIGGIFGEVFGASLEVFREALGK